MTTQTKFNPTDIQIKTWSIQRALDPLVAEVTLLISEKASNTKKGRSKRAHLLVINVIQAIENFINKAKEIADENPDIRNELLQRMTEVKRTGNEMADASKIFADDPCSKSKREQMIVAARILLTSVTHLLILADRIDIELILKFLKFVKNDLQHIYQVKNTEELNQFFKQYEKHLNDLNYYTQRRQKDLVDRIEQEYLAAARATIKRSSTLLLTSVKTYLRHSEISSSRENRDFVYNQLHDALNIISSITQGQFVPSKSDLALNSIGELAKALNEFNSLVTNKSQILQLNLDKHLEEIISHAALLADSYFTREDHRNRIVQECNYLRQILQDLLNESIQYKKKKCSDETINQKIQLIQTKLYDLRKQLRKAVADHISDTFVDTNDPLKGLIDAARHGNNELVEETGQIFMEHVTKLIEVANVVCSMSDSNEGIKLVRLSAKQIESLSPQIINAARIHSAHPTSKVALENINVFRDMWEKHVHLLTDAVDEITTIEDFLAVSENHILEDINLCIQSLVERNSDRVNHTAQSIRGRTDRVINVVIAEMDKYESGEYTETVLESIQLVRNQILPNFLEKIRIIIDILKIKSMQDERKYEILEQELIEVSSDVYHGIRDIRNSVLMNPELEWPSDEECEEGFNDENYTQQSQTSSQQIDYESNDNSSRDMMRRLPKEEREQIEMEVEDFKKSKRDFDREVLKWDDRGNEIIVLAKKMCMIMMEMTDFTRGRGPLRTTMDVINAAKMISECGSKLNKLAKDIAAQCVESQSKSDLAAYVDRITLYCHQLDITSRVKADVQNISGELIVTGLDSATSLITAAKNLMNSVILTVKASYIASTKYRNKSGNKQPIVQWKMRLPEKKPLVFNDRLTESDTLGRKNATKKRLEPLHILSQFQN